MNNKLTLTDAARGKLVAAIKQHVPQMIKDGMTGIWEDQLNGADLGIDGEGTPEIEAGIAEELEKLVESMQNTLLNAATQWQG